MKVCIECTTAELEQIVETIAYGMAYRAGLSARTEVSTRTDDTPNRDREEGVQ